MPGLIPLIKKVTPNRPVLYRSHIQIRSDLVATEGSPQHDVWEFLWSNIKHADMFISHPIPAFVPHNVPREKVVYLPATTDWYVGPITYTETDPMRFHMLHVVANSPSPGLMASTSTSILGLLVTTATSTMRSVTRSE